MSFIRKTASIFSTQVILFFLHMAMSILVARILGPEGKGIYALIFLAPILLSKLGNIGLGVANIYFIGKKEDKIEHIVSNSLVLSIILGILFIGIFTALFPRLHQLFFREIKPYYLFIAILILPISLFDGYSISILLAKDKIRERNLVIIIPAISNLVFFIALVLFTKEYLIAAIFAQILSKVATTICAILWIRKFTKIRFRFHTALARKYINFGIKGYLANIMAFLNYRLDMFLVAYFLTPIDVGYYSLAVGLAELLWYIPNSVSTILYPRVSSSDKKKASEFTPIVSRHTLFVVSLCALGLFIFSRLIIKVVYGAAYLPSVKPLLILLPGIVVLSLSKVFSSYITGRGRPIISTYTSFIVVTSNILLNLVLIPKWGIAGAALASTFSYSLAASIKLIVFLKMSKNSLLDTLVIKKQDIETYILPRLRKLRGVMDRLL